MTVLSRMQVLYIPEVSTRISFVGPVEEEYFMLCIILPLDIALALSELLEALEGWFGRTWPQSSLQLRRGQIQMVMRKIVKSRVEPTVILMIISSC